MVKRALYFMTIVKEGKGSSDVAKVISKLGDLVAIRSEGNVNALHVSTCRTFCFS